MDDDAKNHPTVLQHSPEQKVDRYRKTAARLFWILNVSAACIAVCLYFQLFWLLFLAGIALTINFWKYRKGREGKEGICFFGVLVALTGLIAMIIQYCLSNN
jgi:hypothetical protein